MTIKLTTMHPKWPMARQTPGGAGRWNGADSILDQPGVGADWWFVYDNLLAEETAEIRRGQTVLITPEPPALKTYPPEYVAQFDWALTCHRKMVHPRKVYSHPGLGWHVGRRQRREQNIEFTKSYDELKALWPVPKTKLISVIASDKRTHPGHRLRFDFTEKLIAHFGDAIDVFGWGAREISDKWDGIAPYRYHVVLENSRCPDYWSEKLSDAFLAGAFPIYYGAPNVLEYFSRNALTEIDISKPAAAIRQIETLLAQPAPRLEPLLEARNLILDRYNLFPLMESFARARNSDAPVVPKTIRPLSHFYRPPSLLTRGIHKLRRLAKAKD